MIKILRASANTANNPHYGKVGSQADVANGNDVANDDSVDVGNWGVAPPPLYDAKALHDGMVVRILKNRGEGVEAGTELAHVWYAVTAPGRNAGEGEWGMDE